MKNGNFNEKEEKSIFNEIRILASLNHPNIIRYIESYQIKNNPKTQDESYLVIVMEYCDGGDLFNLINRCIKLKRMIGEMDL